MQGNYVANVPWLAGHVTVAVFPGGNVGFSGSTTGFPRQSGYETAELSDERFWCYRWQTGHARIVNESPPSTYGSAEQKWESWTHAIKTTGPLSTMRSIWFQIHVFSFDAHPKNSLSKQIYSRCPISEILIWGVYGRWSRNLNFLIGELVLGALRNILWDKPL